MTRVSIGVDFGGTFIKFGTLDEAGTPSEVFQLPTPIEDGAEAIVQQIVAGCRRVIDENSLSRENIIGVGIGSPGPLSPSRGIIYSLPNIPGMKNLPLCELVSNELSLPAVLENDANAAALGEFLCGVGKGKEYMIMLTLGTGLGGGIIHRGRVVHGGHEIAGELGHMIVQPNGRQCGCGQKGCLEQYCSASGIIKHATSMILEEGRTSSLAKIIENNDDQCQKLSAQDICQASKQGDQLAGEIWHELTYYLALGCVNFCRIFDPDQIVFAGGISRASDELLQPVKKIWKNLDWNMAENKTDIAIASLGSDAGMIGSAGVAWQRLADVG